MKHSFLKESCKDEALANGIEDKWSVSHSVVFLPPRKTLLIQLSTPKEIFSFYFLCKIVSCKMSSKIFPESVLNSFLTWKNASTWDPLWKWQKMIQRNLFSFSSSFAKKQFLIRGLQPWLLMFALPISCKRRGNFASFVRVSLSDVLWNFQLIIR